MSESNLIFEYEEEILFCKNNRKLTEISSTGPYHSKYFNESINQTSKKRNTANTKERRRTQSINVAFSNLREKIPNVPSDTKLSKIKTLKLAILYIQYLSEVMVGVENPKKGFNVNIHFIPGKNLQNRYINDFVKNANFKQNRCRTGWPQDVWASKVMSEQN